MNPAPRPATVRRPHPWRLALPTMLLAGLLAGGCGDRGGEAPGTGGQAAGGPGGQAGGQGPGVRVTEVPPLVAPEKAPIVVADVGFAVPECVLHDPEADVYLVSNISGNPFAHDDDGFVSRVRPDGTVETLKWLDGATNDYTLNAPKGMAFDGDRLWIADIDHMRVFDRRTGAFVRQVELRDARLLNDVAVGPGEEQVFFTDTGCNQDFSPAGGDMIFRYIDLAARALIRLPDIGGPNGITHHDGRFWIVTWHAGEIFPIDYAGVPGVAAPLPANQLDGIERLDDGFYITSWAGGCVYRLDDAGKVVRVLADLQAPADLGVDRGRNRLLVPEFAADRIVIQPL